MITGDMDMTSPPWYDFRNERSEHLGSLELLVVCCILLFVSIFIFINKRGFKVTHYFPSFCTSDHVFLYSEDCSKALEEEHDILRKSWYFLCVLHVWPWAIIYLLFSHLKPLTYCTQGMLQLQCEGSQWYIFWCWQYGYCGKVAGWIPRIPLVASGM